MSCLGWAGIGLLGLGILAAVLMIYALDLVSRADQGERDLD